MSLKLVGMTTRLVVALAIVAGIAFQPGTASAVDPAPKCEAAKLKEAAKKAKCDATVASKSIKKNEAQDAAKLAKCSTKFNEKFTKAETKADGECPTSGDASSIEGLVDTCIDGVISDLGGAPQGDTDNVKCQSKKAKEAGKYAQCRLKADSKGIKKGLAPDYSKCESKLPLKWGKIEAKPPCLTTGDLASVQADIDACVANIATGLTGNCGNGSVDAGEECDDGNTTGGDGCDALCQNECGNGSVEGAEECDDGNLVNGDGCDDQCMIEPACGDGNLDAGEQCDDGNLINGDGCDDMCMLEAACGDGNLDAGEECDDGNLDSCDGCSDTCLIETTEFSEDFEALNAASGTALSDVGWLAFANVFDGGGGYLYGYGPFGAPNGTGAFSNVAVGEGGVDQGAQQLVVFSDYNNVDHGVGNLIEANVFQERNIVAGDVGKTLTFKFDAKLGDIAGASTALAFIKTLDPGAGFATTNFITLDTTSIPATWAEYSIQLAIDGSLVGQILQYGFSNTATNYEASGIFYDNVKAVTTGGPPPPACGDGNVDAGEQCDDGNLVNGDGCDDMCMLESACGDGNLDGGEECDDGNLVSCDGCSDTCLIETTEFSEDFEALNAASGTALSDVGWLAFANVFDGGGGYLYGYGPFGAPNGTGAFSNVAVGEGGVDQGAQQLVVFSDYNNVDHGVGNLIEANVFQERNIVAGDVGKTLTFKFDAKLGDIAGASTALAFIKTLDPGAGFATTNFITLDTTSIPATWAEYSIQLAIDGSLVGQILQYGFSNTATNYEASGIFYDNVKAVTTGGAPPPVCGDGAVEGSEQCDDGNLVNGDGCDDMCNLEAVPGVISINGDFETGDKTGWTEFLNNGTFTVSGTNTNGGAFSGNLVASVPGGGGPASFPVIKQANIGIGSVVPNGTVTVQFDLNGTLAGVGGVVFAEMFSEVSGGGTSKSEIITGAPLFPVAPNDWTAGWVSYSFNLTLGPDVSGGVTLQLKTDCGANPGCTVDLFIDNVSVSVP